MGHGGEVDLCMTRGSIALHFLAREIFGDASKP
jgi:hypothetical protein